MGREARAEPEVQGARVEPAKQVARDESAKHVVRVEQEQAEHAEMKTTGLGSAKTNEGFSHCTQPLVIVAQNITLNPK